MTIAAIATPNATGGIGIVRISGEKATQIADKLFFGSSVSGMESHKMHLGTIKHNGEVLDKALVCVFRAPHSYTGEDVVEFHCHGGIAVCRNVLLAALSLGAVSAPPGEFTKRAFLNGKMDLSQAEAVADLINAQTKNQVTVAAKQLDSSLSNEISQLRSQLVDATGHLMATMDFSEDGVEPMSYDELLSAVDNAVLCTNRLLSTADDGRIVRDGINTAIVGAPNVGKSSLLNAVLGEDRAIVTNIKGTTRDVLETSVNIRGCRLNLYDTAGIRQSDDEIEKIGISRSVKTLKEADLIFLVADGSKGFLAEEKEILSMIDKSKTILIINKDDLPQKPISESGFAATVSISAKNRSGLEALYKVITEKYNSIDVKQRTVITNPRHMESLIKAKELLVSAAADIRGGIPFDIVLTDIELAISALGEIGGDTVSEAIIDNIFSKFCVGK